MKKLIYSLCYLFGILFFLPLILYKDDSEAKMHANEGLVLLLFAVFGNLVFDILTMIPVIDVLFSAVASIFIVVLLALGILGIVYVATEKNKKLPILGGIILLK